ncbi:MAG: hypothetical protein JSR60_18595 [Proteobacteria bacterium]|nr:hypothetical protein [Pseudomonadota bacterium]
MKDTESNVFLDQARARGAKLMGSVPVAPGLDNFTAYVGLLGSAIELGKLISSEERDLRSIETHHEREMTRIAGAFREVEAAMLADFQKENSLRDGTFETINRLIEAGQFEIASEFHRRLMDGFKRSALELIIDHRNRVAAASTTRIELK